MVLQDYITLVLDHNLVRELDQQLLDAVDFQRYYEFGYTIYEAAKHIRMVYAGYSKEC